jgi:hypothetical protein
MNYAGAISRRTSRSVTGAIFTSERKGFDGEPPAVGFAFFSDRIIILAVPQPFFYE